VRFKVGMLIAGLVLLASPAVKADTFTFNFNSLASGATSSQIASYMDGVIGCGSCVTVTGAVADKTYNGDGHVTGPGTGSTSLTLGTSNGATASNSNSSVGATDTFIANTSDSSSQIANEITIKFTGLTISSTSFDYEIFPDGTCPQLTTSSCGGKPVGGIYPNQPDFEFAVGAGNTAVTAFGTNGKQYGVTPGTTNGNAVHSPNSGSDDELAPQYIGTFSGSLNNVSQLDFIDWPATIGVDNLVITTSTPEPGTLLLLGSGLAGLSYLKRKRKV
jgi:PEP-CTERM motif